MQRDKRYKYVTILFKEGQITTFYEIFDTLPKTVLAKDMGINGARFNTLFDNVFLFSLAEITTISTFFEIDFYVMIRLLDEQNRINKKLPSKNKNSPK